MQSGGRINSASPICRKPKFTYKSPSGGDVMIPSSHKPSIATQVPMPRKPATKQVSVLSYTPQITAPPLPLYHPFGRLAMSLPLLDPTALGLPLPSAGPDESSRRSSIRARRPAAKLRETEEAPVVARVASPIGVSEVREKASPRKRRSGGPAKRKRREADDGDAAYPAKRTRLPRGTANNQIIDEEYPTGVATTSNVDVPPTPDQPPEDITEDKKPERRSTRSRGSIKRHGSSASETTSISASALGGPASAEETRETEEMIIDKKPDETGGKVEEGNDGEKEEGELSEEGQIH